jgi:flagellar hook-basal body complex protein FliE
MRIDPIVPDTSSAAASLTTATPAAASGPGRAFGQLVDAAGAALSKADAAESAFARGTGGLAEMVIERARADVAMTVAATGAQRAASALNTLLGMQI